MRRVLTFSLVPLGAFAFVAYATVLPLGWFATTLGWLAFALAAATLVQSLVFWRISREQQEALKEFPEVREVVRTRCQEQNVRRKARGLAPRPPWSPDADSLYLSAIGSLAGAVAFAGAAIVVLVRTYTS